MSSGDVECKPLSRKDIRAYAWDVRKVLGFDQSAYVDVPALLEFILPTAYEGYTFEVREVAHMGENHGLTNVKTRQLILREDVYERMLDGHGRDRMTAVHELGHLLLHGEERVYHRRAAGDVPPYRDPEWQAKAFAGEFLVSAQFVNDFGSIQAVANGFGVSEEAAVYQLKQLRKDGQIKRADLMPAL